MASILKPRPPPAPTAAAVANSAMKQFGMRPFPRPRGLAGIDLLMQEMQRAQPVGSDSSAPSTPTGANNTGANTARVLGDATNRARRMLMKAGASDAQAPPEQVWPVSARAPQSDVTAAVARWQAPHPPAAQPAAQTSRATSPVREAPQEVSSSDSALRQHPCLTSYERREISGFDRVYYVGEKARKVHAGSSMGNNNYGFDDDKNDYKVIMDDQIAYRYQICQELGRGSFGQVSKAFDHKTKEYVAVKIIKNKKKFHEQALVEIKVLKHLNESDPSQKSCIVKLVDHFVFRNHTVLVFPLLGESLYDVLKANRFQPLPMSSIRSYARQMAQCLALSHRERVVHCDLKPENVLLRAHGSSSLRVIDFGSSCFESEKIYTYIQSRFYRAPEIILGIPYTTSIDMWSLGCMLAELANGYPLFPGENEAEQIQCIMEYMGLPPSSLVDRGPKKRLFFDSTGAPRCVPNSRGKVRKPSTKSLPSFLKSPCDASQSALFLDFIRRCLSWEPADRMTPLEALRHPFLDDAPQQAAAPLTARIGLTERTPGVAGAGVDHALLDQLLPRLANARRRDA